LGVSPRSQALVCRGLRRLPDGSWQAQVAAVPEGFYQMQWVAVPAGVVIPIARPKAAAAPDRPKAATRRT
jgi:hypothetical protein